MIHRNLPLAVVFGLFLVSVRPMSADSALDLLSGFDAERLDMVYPAESPSAIAELAKLVYRLQKIDESSLVDRIEGQSARQLGSVIQLNASIEKLSTLALPSDLADVMEFATIASVTTADAEHPIEIFLPGSERQLSIGDRVCGVGVVIGNNETKSQVTAVAAARLKWFPAEVPNQGWALLRDAGVDVGLLADLGQRDRQSLSAADGDAFYGMLQAAISIDQSNRSPAPKRIDPLRLLQASRDQIGQWIELDLETVQITRVFVTEPNRQRQLGRDHYYQIDAIADLHNVIVKVEGTNDRPALFEGRYPVSVVTVELPPFLQDRIQANATGEVVATALHTKISARGFFFRLWSYETEFMDAHGGGNQFGPLVIAATIENREPPRPATDPAEIIATLAALAVVSGVAGIFWWHRRTTANDLAVRQARQQRAAERVSEFEQP